MIRVEKTLSQTQCQVVGYSSEWRKNTGPLRERYPTADQLRDKWQSAKTDRPWKRSFLENFFGGNPVNNQCQEPGHGMS